MYVSRFHWKKKPEKKLLAVRRETMLLIWARVVPNALSSTSSNSLGGAGATSGGMTEDPTRVVCRLISSKQLSLLVVPGSSSSFHQSRNSFEGCVDIREIKEIRPNSRESKDFHRWSEDVPQDAKKRCFVIYYGSEFNLKSLSCLTLYAEECTLWCQGTPRLHR